MIALDEEMVGRDAGLVIVQGLRSCLALFVRLETGVLFGAHLTTSTSLQGIHLIMDHIRNSAGGSIVWMAMVAKFGLWAKAGNGLVSKDLMATQFKAETGFKGHVYYSDATWAANPYDIRCSAGKPPKLSSRATPNPNLSDETPSADVFTLTDHMTVLRSTSPANARAIQHMPKNTGGFSPLGGEWWQHMKHL